MAEEHVQKNSDSHGERPDKQMEKPQTSQETAEHSVIGGQQKQHQQLHRQALESNPNTHTGSSFIENPNNNFESIQILEAIPGTDEKRVIAERAKPDKESQMPVKTFDKRPDAPEHRESKQAEQAKDSTPPHLEQSRETASEQPSKAANLAPSYIKGLAAIADTSTTPQQAEARQKKFDKFYQLGKEVERQAAAQNPPEKIAMAAGPRPALQPVAPKLDQQPDMDGFVSWTEKAGTFQTIRQDFSKPGESLLDVAKRLAPAEMSPADVEAWANQSVHRDGNNVHEHSQVLEAGTKVTLRPFEKAEAARADDFTVYTVQPGDSLWKIGTKTLGPGHSSPEIDKYVKEIGRLNNLSNLNIIHPGDQLRLPTVTGGSGEQNISPTHRPEPQPQPEQPEPAPEPTPDKLEPTAEIEEFDFESPEAKKQFHDLERLADRYYADSSNFHDSGFPKEVHDAIGQATGREHLLELAKKHHFEGDRLNETIETIEDRVARKEVSPDEIKKTYEQIERLLETPSKAGVTDEQREIIAQQILDHVANPNHIDQGNHNTCNVCTVERRIFGRTPSDAAKLISDVALNGEYTTADGTLVDLTQTFAGLDGKPITMLVEPTKDTANNSLGIPVPDGKRSYASEIFQICAVNIHYQLEGKGTHYVQEQSSKANSTGEYLYKADGTVDHSPELGGPPLIEIHNAITGSNDTGFVLGADWWGYSPEAGITNITSPADLEQKLQDIEKANNFPVIIEVHTGSEPFWSDSGGGSAGGAGGETGGGHVVSITGIDHGPPMRIKVDNQWGTDADHLNEVTALSSRDLYYLMLDPITATNKLDDAIKGDRENGHRDAWNELEYERLRLFANLDKRNPHQTPPREIEMDIINTLANTFDPQAHQPGEWEKPGILYKLGQIMPDLPRESQIRIQREQARLGLISHDDYKKALIAYGRFTADAIDVTEEQTMVFPLLLGQLSGQEQSEILIEILGLDI